MPFTLEDFIEESNRIEDIEGFSASDILAHGALLVAGSINVEALALFVKAIQPDAVLRDHEGLDVVVGNHRPPPGSPTIRHKLETLLSDTRHMHAYEFHQRYENLHPFTDGNGRSGRALWLKMMGGISKVPLGFLHTWYYQSLQEGRR